MRWGLGPVFIYECLTNSRRRQTYAIRAFGVAALLVAMGTIAASQDALWEGRSVKEYADLGESYFYPMIGMELALVMLVAPAATAGAICVDRARGTLEHVLATDLSDSEIVLGKLAARLMPVLGLVACSWPVLAISTSLGGIDPIALILAFGVILAVALLGCTMALALSISARKPYEVVLAVYAFWAAMLLAYPFWEGVGMSWLPTPSSQFLLLANPFYVAFLPYGTLSAIAWQEEYALFLAATLGCSLVLTWLAVWRTRPVAVRSQGRQETTPQLSLVGRMVRRLPGPSLDRNPVLWREWHRTRSPRMSLLLALLLGSTTMACVLKAYILWNEGGEFRWYRSLEAEAYPYLLYVPFGLLVLSAVAPMTLSEERQSGSLDVLMTTPLSSWTILRGKWLSAFHLVPWLAIGPGVMALALALSPTLNKENPFIYRLRGGERLYACALLFATILVHGAAIVSLGLILATWIRRQSRAIAISVTLFALVSIGCPMMVLGSGRFGEAIAALSPIVTVFGIVASLSRPGDSTRDFLWWATIWDVCTLVVALGFLWLTVRTFERCLGRMPEHGAPLVRRPARKPPVQETILVGK